MSDFLTRAQFSKMVIGHVQKKRIPYMEAVILMCEEKGIEVEDVKKFLSKPVREKIEAEAVKLNLLPRGDTKAVI